MMTIISLFFTGISLILKMVGLHQHAAGFRDKADAIKAEKARAQAAADQPVTDKEWSDEADKGNL